MTTVIGLNVAGQAVVLHAPEAVLTLTAGIDIGSNTDSVTYGKLCDLGANLGYLTQDLVTWNHREDALKPFVSNLVNIRVADARVENLDSNRIFTQRSKWHFRLFKLCAWGLRNK